MSGRLSTDRVREAGRLACEEATRLRCRQVEAGHLLLAILDEGSGMAALAVKNQGVDLQTARREVENLLMAAGSQGPFLRATPLAPDVTRCLRAAAQIARGLRHQYVGTEHLLLALLDDADGIAVCVLRHLRVKPFAVRREVFRLLGWDAPEKHKRPLSEFCVNLAGNALFGSFALIASVCLGALAGGLIYLLVTAQGPADLRGLLLFHIVIDLSAIASVFMFLVAIGFWTGGHRWVDSLVQKMLPKGFVAVLGLLALLFLAAGNQNLAVVVAFAVFLFVVYPVFCTVAYFKRKKRRVSLDRDELPR